MLRPEPRTEDRKPSAGRRKVLREGGGTGTSRTSVEDSENQSGENHHEQWERLKSRPEPRTEDWKPAAGGRKGRNGGAEPRREGGSQAWRCSWC